MDPERWKKMDELLQEALQQPVPERERFLRKACGGDTALEQEVRSLLASYQKTGSFLQRPAIEVAAQASTRYPGSKPPGIGRVISHYRVLSELGSGGMGVVYLAEDIRLGRRVALKFLPEKMARDPRTLQRFQREARAASSLNHPSICTIFEIEEHDDQPVIVMELLQGESVKERIQKGAIQLPDLLEFGIQISDALQAAHAKGIIHRDIKPANLFVVEGRRIKILDFGLVKMAPTQGLENEVDEESLTMEGVIPGTTAYMSPEQIQGEQIDGRSDVFSLGVVLFEMATGKKPFTGKNRIALMDAILRAKPTQASTLNPLLPKAFDEILTSALEKNRNDRYQQAVELGCDLKRLQAASQAGQPSILIPAARRHRSGIASWKLFTAICAVMLAAAALFLWRLHPKSSLTEKDSIVLAEFTNSTGDPVFDETLRQGLAVQLEQSPFLSIISEDRIQESLRLMAKAPNSRLTPQVAREICERTGGAAVLDGSITSLGTQYVLGLRARDCRGGRILLEQQVQARRKEDVLKALGEIASQFRSRMGESLATLEKHNTPLETATTPSLEALKAYSTAKQLEFSVGNSDALLLLKRAIEIDPQFATAYAAMGLMYSNLGESELASESTRKAYQMRDHASDRERFFIIALYDRQVTGNLERQQQTLRSWAQTYPRDRDAHGLLSGFASQVMGEYEKSISEARIALEIDPNFTPGYVNIGFPNFFLNRWGESENILREAYKRNRLASEFYPLQYYLAFVRGDQAEMDRVSASAKGKPGVEDWMLHSQALVAARAGRRKEAQAISRRARDIASEAGQKESAATYQAAEAVWQALYGDATAAHRSALAALTSSKGRDVEYAAAAALAFSGDSVRVEILVDDLAKRFPEDTSVRFNYLPTLRGLLAVNRNQPDKAIEVLQPSGPYDFAVPAVTFNEFFGGMYPVYVRGLARLAEHRPRDAATEFQKILDHPGIVMADPVGAMAHLQLARANAMAGDEAKARLEYDAFLTSWKNADADVPILKKAKMEYASLR